jgi:isochorismate synthase EntC
MRVHAASSAHVQHLLTPFEVDAPAGLHLLDVRAVLHPSPAVAGLPQDAARGLIAQIEDGPRGLYSGPVGWIDPTGGGELAVCCAAASSKAPVPPSTPAQASWRVPIPRAKPLRR